MRVKWEKKPFFFLQNMRVREKKRGCRDRIFDFSLRSKKLGWSSCIGPRLKVGILVRATRGHQNQEFSSQIRDESS